MRIFVGLVRKYPDAISEEGNMLEPTTLDVAAAPAVDEFQIEEIDALPAALVQYDLSVA